MHFSAAEWEDFVLEWGDSLKTTYSSVDRCGQAGDMGRDVIAYHKDDPDKWDNFQCKHYRTPLAPSTTWVELGKLFYYTHRGDYTMPEQYTFVAPRGAGTTLANLLRKPAELRSGLFANWDDKCRKHITSTCEVPLDASLRKHINSCDFSIFRYLPPLQIIQRHAETRWHVVRFGGGLPPRPAPASPPATPATQESTYIRQLLDAYGDCLKLALANPGELTAHQELNEHFGDSRREFYSAESLRTFSRDTLPPGAFETLQDEIHSGIRDSIRQSHEHGYARLLAAVQSARALQITSHALVSRLTVRDRGGICHQLANDSKVRWVP